MSGTVYLAKVRRTNATCCVKVMRKKKLLRLDQAENIVREKALSRAFFEDTSFIMQSRCAFQDKTCLYLVMDFMPGGDLFQMLVHGTGARGAFKPAAARFYASEVFLALEFLHHRHFVYRDLKPENVLVDGNGHVKLADLGFCKRVRPGERTYTTCGTSDYMAPEVMLSQGYDQSADLWAFGVFVFELLAGHAPFKAETDARRHRRILTADLRFAPDFHLHAKDLVAKLCVVEPSLRLGCASRGLDDVKDHVFWEADWGEVAARARAPPARPEMRDAAKLCQLEPMRGVGAPRPDEALTDAENAVFKDYF
jgi:protein kinase X